MPSTAPEDALRQKLVDAARESWISRLIDLSRRNNLLFYRPIQSSTIEVSSENAALVSLLEGDSVAAHDLLTSREDRPRRVLEISRKALENLEEKGLATLYLACGLATWPASDGGRAVKAPVVLLPLTFKRKGQDTSSVEVSVSGDAQVNPVLLHVLQTEFNVRLTSSELLVSAGQHLQDAAMPSGEHAEQPTSMQMALAETRDRLLHAAGGIDGFNVEQTFVIGNFAFQKMAMVRDLEELGPQLLSNDIVAAIAGDVSARARLGSSQTNVDPMLLDQISPEAEFAVIEADSSQQCAIAGIVAGQSAVVHGPPGTGKSQTITNLITTLVGSGKTVLFVAEKRAALEVVLARLEHAGLGHLAIDLHGAEQTPKKIMERIAKSLSTVRTATEPHVEELHRQFQERRSRLNEHCSRMHSVTTPSGMSLFAMQGALLQLPDDVVSHVRWRGPELAKLTALASTSINDLLREASGLASLFLRNDASLWTGSTFGGGTVEPTLDAARTLGYEELPAIQQHLEQLEQGLQLRMPLTLTETGTLLFMLKAIEDLAARYSTAELFREAPGLLATLETAHGSGFRSLLLRVFQPAFRSAYKKLVALRKGQQAPIAECVNEIKHAVALQGEWDAWSHTSSTPAVYLHGAELERHYASAIAAVKKLEAVLARRSFEELPLATLTTTVRELADDTTTPYRLMKLTEIEEKLSNLGIQKLVNELREKAPPVTLWNDFYKYAWMQSCIDDLANRDSQVKGFVGATHNQYVEEFKVRDSDRLKAAAQRVRRLHALRTIEAMNQHPAQEALIKQEASKIRKHKPLRYMFKQAGDVLKAVTPCFMASPLSVSQLIDAEANFDYVIFDEASQVLPEDAIPSILRGKHLIVAGDNKQLPPTGFFSASNDEDDEDEENEAVGYESLLDMMIPFAKSFFLNWHYRSRSESLIAFSNHHIYDDRLITFPGPGGPPAVRHELVDFIPAGDVQEESSSGEVQRVVDLVIRHAEQTPALTLGVITMGIKHAYRIQGALDKALASRKDLADFFDMERKERFFVKNLERVQGDERDSIIMSIGYGKDRAGNLPLRFGPILSEGGRRRLNVAVTRARSSMIVVSSFAATDIDGTKVKPQSGLEFLRSYLQYAASGGRLLSSSEITNEPMDDFEADVHEALAAKGVKTVPQVGCSKFRIDLAACHPTEPGRFVLAIECDGATYHSSYTARDRDRIRQQQLENLGWTFHRIWSTDWFLHKDEEVRRAVVAFEAAVAKSDAKPDYSQLPCLPEREATDGLSSISEAAAAVRSTAQPPIPERSAIMEYSDREMKALFDWVCSDGILRTHEELADEMFAALPFSRRGSRIEEVLMRTIRRHA